MALQRSRLTMYWDEKVNGMRREGWLKIGCFLTGYNYVILQGCSESSIKRVLRYTSAMLIICILWAFIGYTFTSRYLKTPWLLSITGAIVMVIIVIQIERQVILSNKTNKAPLIFRAVIALLMGIIGSILIDQMLFKEDIEQQKTLMMGEKVNKVLPDRARELKDQIKEIDSVLAAKEQESKLLSDEIEKRPMISVYTENREHFRTREGKDSTKRTVAITKTPNPKMELLKQVDLKNAGLRKDKNKKDSLMLTLRPIVEAELKQNVGFLDELELMWSLLTNSYVALITWIIWFVLLLGLECFILVSKWNEPEVDYDEVVRQQMELHLRRLRLLTNQ